MELHRLFDRYLRRVLHLLMDDLDPPFQGLL